MIAVHKKKPVPFPRAKIARIIEGILPKGKNYELRASDSGIRQLKVVRIVTPAWRNLRPPERISKVLAAMNEKLTEAEQEGILRVSVLTPDEYDRVLSDSVPVPNALRPLGKKRAAKRKMKPTFAGQS